MKLTNFSFKYNLKLLKIANSHVYMPVKKIGIVKNEDMDDRKNMSNKTLKEIIIDSLKYSASDLKMVVILGLVLLIADNADNLTYTELYGNEIKLLFLAVVIIMAIFEAGYIFRILVETIQGSKKLPKFNNLKLMFTHGLNEIIILILYFSIPVIIFILFYLNFLNNLNFNVLPIVNYVFISIILILTVLIYVFFPAVILHRAHNNGNFRSSFDFGKIYHKIRSIGFKRLIIVYLGLFLIVTIIKTVLTSTFATNIPLIGEVIPDLLIAPYLLIFTTRFLGLIDKP
jgi:hypothetical protein